MSIDALTSIVPTNSMSPATVSALSIQPSFEALMSHFDGLNLQMVADQKAVTDLALGRADNLHQVMMGMEQTRLAFELTLAVRNKVLEAYQELMRMQV